MTDLQPFPEMQQDADRLVFDARVKHRPIRSFCLFSGGNDSTVLAHRCRDHYDTLAHINTGTAVPGVLQFVQDFAKWVDKPLVVYDSTGWFENLVLGGWERPSGEIAEPLGFPGPGQHGRAYTLLKERRIEDLVRDAKKGHPRSARVMLLSGKRRAESARRAKTTVGIEARGGQLYVNPLIDWTRIEMLSWRQQHRIPQSDVAALLHRSGECNCGAFASAGEERAMLKHLWPGWFAWIEGIEARADTLGLRWCRWGGYDAEGVRAGSKEAAEKYPDESVEIVADESAGELCSSCSYRDQLAMEVAA